MRPKALAAVCAALLVAAAVPAVGAGGTIEIRSKHYRIETDVGRRFARVARQHMENMLSAYRRTMPQFGQSLDQTFHVKIFRRQSDYNEVAPSMAHGSGGIFMSHKRMLAAFMENRTPDSVFRTLYHEGFHQYLYQTVGPRAPLWVNEGLAEYFAEGTWNGNGFTLGQVPLKRLHVLRKAIRRNNIVPLNRLVEMDTKEWTRNIRINKSRASLQYSEAWSFVHFLLHGAGSGGGRRLMNYLKALSRGTDADRAFQEHFGGDMRALQAAWKKYVFRLQPSAKSLCKRNLRLLTSMAREVGSGPRDLPSVQKLSRQLLRNRSMKWSVKGPHGSSFSSENRDRAARLFRCPADRNRQDASYRVGPSVSGSVTYYCTHHRGIILRAYLALQEGRIRVQVEERVVDTLDRNVRRALANR